MSEHQPSEKAEWADIFPFDPYPNQVKGINSIINTLESGGFHLLEGPCGTGKTLIGLTSALSLVRDPKTKFERILVITSKKQQLSAFESDLKAINNQDDVYFPGLTLIGKSELCPYVQTGHIGEQEIYHECISLRDNTQELMEEAVKKDRTAREANAAFGLQARAEQAPKHGRLTVNGKETPYMPEIPSVGDTEYCPFYASHITNAVQEEYPLSIHRVTTGEETLTEGSACGTCPHIEMRRLYPEATVTMGNYKHAFGPRTVSALTAPLVDKETILICDEAHGLVSEVRDQLSYGLTYSKLNHGVGNLKEVYGWLTGDGHQAKQRLASSLIADSPLETSDFATSIKFLEKLRSFISQAIVDGLKDEHGASWRADIQSSRRSEISIPMQSPTKPEPDPVSKWAEKNDYGNIWKLFLQVAKLTDSVKDIVSRKIDGKSPDGSFPIGAVYELFERWWVGSHSEYFRRVTLSPRQRVHANPNDSMPWRAGYLAKIQINNSIPQNEIAATLDAFGGAILMSATLSPLDIYSEVTGVTKLKNGTQPPGSLVTKAKSESERQHEDKDPRDQLPDLSAVGKVGSSSDKSMQEKRRTVGHSEFELGFPKEHRLSVAVDVPKFTYSNRWPPEENLGLRNTYSTALSTVVRTTPGNVLVCMPSYDEAAWASDVLNEDSNVQKEILTDSPSSDAETQCLKEEFIDGPPKVLTTSLRGTLTEGVDYDGDKLRGVVICGVPITTTGTPLAKAIETAYNHRFDGKGFEYAFTVPAVRKARQAIGRVIRGQDEVGVRVLIDQRYVQTDSYTSVREYFPEHAREEFIPIGIDDLGYELQTFWKSV
ncbi:ATP-dependent DNA helicase [Haloarcula sp. K1]|uniref:ATP-dependent DNA helicase n=1 Tax=Haloarcula sp. K1 TaxID=1622207 RepID=UPI0007BBD956|nr:ATP-dependent DNA helicase [Haloarcula sp. K1]KZX46242.1 hypothetical protein AV929_15840 [Haloarcula sp. K1]